MINPTVTVQASDAPDGFFRTVVVFSDGGGTFSETGDCLSRSPLMASSHALHELANKLEARYRAARDLIERGTLPVLNNYGVKP